MPLRVIDTGEIWKGERVRGVLYTHGIETKFSDEELLRAGFERAPDVQPVVPIEDVPQTVEEFDYLNQQNQVEHGVDLSKAFNAETKEI